MNPSKQAWKGYALTLLAASCWATGGLTAKYLDLAPGVMTAARSLVAGLVLGVILILANREAFCLKEPRRDIPFILFFGVAAQSGMQFTYLMSISLNAIGVAILLEYLAPVFSLLFALVFFRQRPKLMALVGIAVTIVGCALVVGVADPSGICVSLPGFVWGIASAFFFSLYTVLGERVKHRFSSATLIFYGMIITAVTWITIMGPSRVAAPFLRPETMLPILAVGVLSTLLPFGAFLMALRYIPPVNAGITATIEPVLAAIGGAVLFAEALTGGFIIGGILILAAIAIIQISDAWSVCD